MKDYQREFIQFALECNALRFGEFTLKSGRISPYFFNAGQFNTGKTIARLGQFYAHAIINSGIAFDMLFGPAYKGIPLATSVAIALAEQHNVDKPYAFNRKEIKLRGEGGMIVGSPLQGKVLVVDDVISAGVTIGETVQLLEDARCEMVGIAISVDRQERTQNGSLSAVDQVKSNYRIPVINIIQLTDLTQYLEENPQYSENLARIYEYTKLYGTAF